MDASPLLLILATTLSVPSGPAVDTASVRKVAEVRRLERTKAWLREHWAQQMKVLADSQSCATQARGWGDLNVCARMAQQRTRAVEDARSSCGPAEDVEPMPTATAISVAATPGAMATVTPVATVPVLTAGQH